MKLAFPGLLLAALTTWFVAHALLPAQWHPYLAIATQDGVEVHILQSQARDETSCHNQLGKLGSVTLSTCPNCRLISNTCLSDLKDPQSRWLGGDPIELPSATNQTTVIVFKSEQVSDAQSSCQIAADLSKAYAPSQRLGCFAPNTDRPTVLTENDSSNTAPLIDALSASLGALGLIVMASLYAASRRARFPKTCSAWLEKAALVSTDFLTLSTTFLIVGAQFFDKQGLYSHFGLSLLTIAWFWVLKEHYARRRPFWDELREVFATLSIVLLIALSSNLKVENTVAPVLITWLALFGLIPLGRATLRAYMHALGIWELPAVIVGTGENAREAFMAIHQEKNLGYRVIAFAAPSEQINPPKNLDIAGNSYPVIHLATDDPASQLAAMENPKIIIGLDSLAPSEHQNLIKTLSRSQQNIHIIPSIRGLPLFGTQLSHFFSHEVLFMTVRNNLARRSYRWIKRVFDLCISTLLLILLSPVFVTLTLLIRRNGGSAFYGHPRIGQDGQVFKCLKFRSMRPDANEVLKALLANDPQAKAEWDNDFKLKNDPRITPIGHFIRKTSLDELPQLFNVLRGEMSLVGPRPVVQDELTRYGSAAVFYLEAKPGITGLWQVSGRNDTTYAERVSLDSWYVQNWSLWYDIAILFRTVDVVFNRKGAY